MDSNTSNPLKKILILAANPKGTSTERLGQELRDIAEGLRRAQKRDQFALEQHLAVRPRDIQRAILDFKPHIVYFSGHGGGEEGLVFEDETGQSKLVSGAALAGLFQLFADETECVLLNGCYSEVQAKAIAKHINYVIGMNQAISDRAAIEFAVGFYDALGAGRSIEFAYNWGCIAIRMEGIEEHLTPVLLKKEENDKVEIFVSNFQEGEKLKKFQTQWLRRIPRRSIFTTLGASVGVTILVVLVRLLGILPGEFFFFNQMMIVQPVPEEPDKHLLIVQITLDDITHYSEKYPPKNSSSLADKILYQLLKKLLNNNPRVIGIDNYRYAPAEENLKPAKENLKPAEENLKNLINKEKTNDRLIFICKFPDKDASDKDGHSPPPDVPIEQVGLSDLLTDRDGVIRRQIIQMGTPEDQETKNQCRNKEELMDSFSFKVAQKYLAAEKKDYKISGKENENIVSGKTFLQPLNIDMQGGYSLKDLNGTQILLNYRFAADAKNNRSLRNIAAKTYNVKRILEGEEIKDFVQGKIVLIGTPVPGYDSPDKSTPFSIGGADVRMSGLFIQAQMVSQLVSAVKDERPLLKVMHISYDMLWILVWSVIGGAILPQLYKYPQKLLITGGIFLGSLYFICLVFFIYPIIPRTKLWIPLVPTAVSFVGSGPVRVFLELKFKKNSKLK